MYVDLTHVISICQFVQGEYRSFL